MGFINTKGLSEDEVTLVEEIIEERADQGPDDSTYDTIQKMATIADISTVRTTYNMDSDKDVISSIIGAINGTDIKVAYYQRLKDSILSQTSQHDVPHTTDPLDTDLVCIHNFSIRLNESFDYTYDNDSNISGILGSGHTYPGFKPTKGDMFLYPIATNQIGIFKLTNITRMSVSKLTVFSINFELHKFATGQDVDNFQKSVVKELYFEKDTFLSGSNNMLETSEYRAYTSAKGLVTKLVRYYFTKFYDNGIKTVIRRDGVFDPYIVKFLSKFLSTSECGYMPRKYMDSLHYDRTIWGIFERDVDLEIEELLPWLYIEQHMYSPNDVNLNNLIEKLYIRHAPLCPYGYSDTRAANVPTCQKHHKSTVVDEVSVTCTSELYIFSQNFYEATDSQIEPDPCCYLADPSDCIGHTPVDPSVALSAMEAIVVSYINKEINYDSVVTYATAYKSLNDKEQFYYIPMLIYILKEYVFNLTN